MWTRSAANKENGKITVTCTDWNGALFFTGEFDNLRDAEKAGEDAERRMTMAMQNADVDIDELFDDLNDDELLRELAA